MYFSSRHVLSGHDLVGLLVVIGVVESVIVYSLSYGRCLMWSVAAVFIEESYW